MGSKIFREKSIEKVSSPEQLDEYLRVPNINVWLVLLTLFIMAISVFIWSLAGNIVTKVDTTGAFTSATNGQLNVRAVVSVDDAKNIEMNMPCKIYNRYSESEECTIGHITYISKDTKKFDFEHYPESWVGKKVKSTNEGIEVIIEQETDSENGSKYKWNNGKEPANQDYIKRGGLCKVEIITESIKPIDFLFSEKEQKNG